MTFSEIYITINTPFLVNWEMSIVRVSPLGGTTTEIYRWKDVPTSRYNVPTAGTNALTATNLGVIFLDENPTGFEASVTGDTLTIRSETLGENWLGVSVVDELGNLFSPDSVYSVSFNNYVEPATPTNVDLALVRSPHYVSTNFVFDTTTKATIDLKVWSGDIDTPPSVATYTLTRIRPTSNAIDLDTNLSPLIKSNLEPSPNIVTTLPVQLIDSNLNSVKWINYVVTFTDPDITVTPIEGTFSGLDGYGYFKEGANPTKPTDRILTSNKTMRKASRTGVVLIPFVNDSTYVSVDIVGDVSLNTNILIAPSNISSQYIKYVCIDCSQLDDNIVAVSFNGGVNAVVTFQLIDECKFTPRTIVFKNKYGAFETMDFFKKSVDKLNVNKENFVNQFVTNLTYDINVHQYKDINFDADETITMNTGFISEFENTRLKELLLSDQVWIYENENLIPVSVDTSSIEFKTRVNDKLINYTMDFKYAYSTIQNV